MKLFATIQWGGDRVICAVHHILNNYMTHGKFRKFKNSSDLMAGGWSLLKHASCTQQNCLVSIRILHVKDLAGEYGAHQVSKWQSVLP
jgi:hypothetical protein